MGDKSSSKMETTIPMSIFEDLASVADKSRVSAAELLQKHLINKENPGSDADITYTIKRLVRGLASNRKLARVGFATALANCLTTQFIPVQATMASLSDPTSGGQFLKTNGSMGKADRTNTVIGQLFFVASIAKGLLHSPDVAPIKSMKGSEINKLAMLCVDAFKQKPVLRQMACSVLSQLIAVLLRDDESLEKHKAVIFSAVQPLLKSGWSSSTSEVDAADMLLLALVSEPIAPPDFWTESSWLLESPGSSRSQQSFIYSLLSDPGKVAAIVASARQTPFVHLVAVKLFELLSFHIGRRKIKKRFFQLWSELVNERLLLPASPVSHKIAALQLASVVIGAFLRRHPDLIPVIISEQLTSFLTLALRRRNSREHEAATAFFEELGESISRKQGGEEEISPDYHLTILACFIKPPMRIWQELSSHFDKLIQLCPPSAVAQFSELLKSILVSSSFYFNYGFEKVADEAVELQRWDDAAAAMSARRWAVARLSSCLTFASTAQSSDDVTSIISSICEACLFGDSPQSENNESEVTKGCYLGLLPRDQAVNYVLRAVCSATSSVAHIPMSVTADCISVLKSVLHVIKKRIGNADMPPLIQPLTGSAEKSFLSLLKISKKKTRPDTVHELLRLFACHGAVLLLCYPNDPDIIQLGTEIGELFSAVTENSDGDDDVSSDGPARVFLDMLISLLSRKSRPLRQVTTNMFSKLISNHRLLGLLTSSSNADSDSKASSLVDLIVNALLNTQFVEDHKDEDDDDIENNDESDGSNNAGDEDEKDEGNEEDGTKDQSDVGKKTKSNKRKRTLSGHLVVPPAGANVDNSVGDDASSVDSVLMDDEDMFKLDAVFAAAVKAATSGGGPAKRAKRERKNKIQEVKEFHMKLISWLEMVVRQAQEITNKPLQNGEQPTCDGYQIQIDIVGVLLNTLANRKKQCSVVIESRLGQVIKSIIMAWRQSKLSDSTINKVAQVLLAPFSKKSGVAPGEYILDSALQIIRNVSSVQFKLDAAATVVELLLLCSDVLDSPTVKSKFIISALRNSLDAYLAHPTPHGNIFFVTLLSSNRLPLKQLERIFFDRLLKCLSGNDAQAGAKEEGDDNTEDSHDKKSAGKLKSFPRSQAARLLTNSTLTTPNAYIARPRLREELSCVLDEVLQTLATDCSEAKKTTPQSWFCRSVIDLSRRHANSVLATASSVEEKAERTASLSKVESALVTIRDNSVGKKSADIRSVCNATLRIIRRYQDNKEQKKANDQSPVKSEGKKTDVAGEDISSSRKRRTKLESESKVVKEPASSVGIAEKSNLKRRKTPSPTESET